MPTDKKTPKNRGDWVLVILYERSTIINELNLRQFTKTAPTKNTHCSYRTRSNDSYVHFSIIRVQKKNQMPIVWTHNTTCCGLVMKASAYSCNLYLNFIIYAVVTFLTALERIEQFFTTCILKIKANDQ